MWNPFKPKEAPKQEAEKQYVTEESPEQVLDRSRTNTKITVDAIAESMFNQGMIKGGEGRNEKMAIAHDMAVEAVNTLSPEQRQNMETMDTNELRGGAGALVMEAITNYNERQEAVAASIEADEVAAEAAKEAAEREAA